MTNDLHEAQNCTSDTAADLFRLLCDRRGFNTEYLSQIEDGEHRELKDMPLLIEALHEVRADGRKLVVSPDYDMDGISSAVLGYAGFSQLGFDVELQIPDYERGHDLSVEDVEDIARQWPETAAIITCDRGVNSHAGIQAAKDAGWLVMVTDHHTELEPGCNAHITVNPCRIDEEYELKGICGAHVLWQVLNAYAARYAPEQLWHMRLLRLFAAIGTVSDVMPLVKENRVLVRDGLALMRLMYAPAPRTIPNRFGGMDPDPKAIDPEAATLMMLIDSQQTHPVFRRIFLGFGVMLQAFAVAGKLRDVDSLDEGFFGFYLAPAMNAPRRTQTPLRPCFEVFTAEDMLTKIRAAQQVVQANALRRQMVTEFTAELLESEQPLAPWVYLSSGPAGVLGLLAAQVSQLSGGPAVVLSRTTDESGRLSGSARAPEWFDVIGTLEGVDRMRAVGHRQACGVQLEDGYAALQTLREHLSLAAERDRPEIDPNAALGDLVLGTTDDCDFDLSELRVLVELVEMVKTLKPFGQGHREPVFELRVEPNRITEVRTMGSEQQHLRLRLDNGLECPWWNAADQLEALKQCIETDADPIRLVVKLDVNTFAGQTRPQAVIDQWVRL